MSSIGSAGVGTPFFDLPRLRGEQQPDSDPATTNRQKGSESASASEVGPSGSQKESETEEGRAAAATSATEKTANGRSLTEEQLDQVRKLKQRDREVRAHEQAHLGAAGQYASGGPSFTYQVGPDGRRYAVGGEVGIDTSPVAGDPEATIRKAQQIRRAALAPAEPSGQDRAVAAAASQLLAQAQKELREQQATEATPAESETESTEPDSAVTGDTTATGTGPAGNSGEAESPSTDENPLGFESPRRDEEPVAGVLVDQSA